MPLPSKRIRLVVAVVLLTLLSAHYALQIQARHQAKLSGTSTAPNGEYRVEYYLISEGLQMRFLFRLFDRKQELVGEYDRLYDPGGWREGWTCIEHTCSQFSWGSQEEDRIKLPPTRLDRLRAKLP